MNEEVIHYEDMQNLSEKVMNAEQLENSSPPSILPVDTGAGAGAIAGLAVGYVLLLLIRRKIRNDLSRFRDPSQRASIYFAEVFLLS